MEAADIVSQEQMESNSTREAPEFTPLVDRDSETIWVEPDLEFIRLLSDQAGEVFKKCFQCGTCSAACPVSPEQEPFPRKEMAWAIWGMRDQLLSDPDVWLCHQCNDCSTTCPRSGRPGDVLAAIRQQSILHYSRPQFLARWVQRPTYIPLLLAIPALLLGLALMLRDPIATALNIYEYDTQLIIYPYSSIFPHWLLNGFFSIFAFLSLVAMGTGVTSFWRSISDRIPGSSTRPPPKGLLTSFFVVLKRIISHEEFALCTTRHSHLLSHGCVFFGFSALTAVTLWVISDGFNPLVQSHFVYPFSFWDPWKVLANIGGAALLTGCLLIIWDRLGNRDNAGASTYFDWAFVWTLFAVGATGFLTEGLHYLRMVPHRHAVYFVHLVLVLALLIYLPYTKFAHLIYRTAAMVFAESSGRTRRAAAGPESAENVGDRLQNSGTPEHFEPEQEKRSAPV